MSIVRTFNGKAISHPGAATKLVIENLTGFPLSATGTVGIVGEAVGGQPGVLDILSREGIQDAKARYKSGPIADALQLLAEPSKDGRITNGASKIVVYKTNHSTQSALTLKNASSVDMVPLSSKNYGTDENNLNAVVSIGQVLDTNAKIAGSVAGPFTVAITDTLILVVNGTSYTYTCSLAGSKTASDMVTDINNAAHWAAAKPVIASANGTMVDITLDPAVVTGGVYDYGYISVNATSTLDTILGITGTARGYKGSRFFTFVKGTATETSLELGGVKMMSVKYVGAGTAATLSLKKVSSEVHLTTTITGASSDNLDILLVDSAGNNRLTIKDLSDQINAHAAYESAVMTGVNANANVSQLDWYDALPIKDVAAYLNQDIYSMVNYLNTYSQYVVASKSDNVYGTLAIVSTPAFFTLGADGTSANSDFAAGFTAFQDERINVVIPLISKDQGSLTIDSINQLAASHSVWGWSSDGKSERSAFVSKSCSKELFKSASKAISSGLTSIFGQEVQVLDKNSNLVWQDPWAEACVAAGMRAGAEVGEPITYKYLNVNNIRAPLGDWSPKKDYAEMIEAGCTFAESVDSGGFRWVVGNTTYGADASFVWNRESVVQAAGYVAYDLRGNLESVFTGTKAKTGTAEAIANFIKARMTIYRENDLIVGDDLNEGLGYKKLSVSIQGNTAIINVSITPVQGIDFILATIYLADIRQTA